MLSLHDVCIVGLPYWRISKATPTKLTFIGLLLGLFFYKCGPIPYSSNSFFFHTMKIEGLEPLESFFFLLCWLFDS